METLLKINDLYVNAGEKEILKGLNLEIKKGETHVIMDQMELENQHLQMLY